MNYGREIAKAGLEIKAIKLNFSNPFTWASGYRMPIYNDNRMFLGDYRYRKLIRDGFIDLIQKAGDKILFDIIAGTSTAGISPATTLADYLMIPLIYVRDKPKDHGLRNQIEGIDSESDLQIQSVVLIEDLISTGESSARAVQTIRDAKGVCNNCISIFDYGLNKAVQTFNNLDPKCNVYSLLDYETLLQIAKEINYINSEQKTMLVEWRTDPFGWGENHGFPIVER